MVNESNSSRLKTTYTHVHRHSCLPDRCPSSVVEKGLEGVAWAEQQHAAVQLSRQAAGRDGPSARSAQSRRSAALENGPQDVAQREDAEEVLAVDHGEVAHVSREEHVGARADCVGDRDALDLVERSHDRAHQRARMRSEAAVLRGEAHEVSFVDEADHSILLAPRRHGETRLGRGEAFVHTQEGEALARHLPRRLLDGGCV
mmetsp:Transcript_28206/g.70960  ORF Transcript_28206/g.70960 Transcript_28206/m.70960 type:complete len:202 (+) Transcript_28206:62-667(+)